MGRATLFALALGVATGCTGENPEYVADGGTCHPGERTCVHTLRGQLLPIVCGLDVSGTLLPREERCPPQGACSDGQCTAPVGAQACERQQDCGANEVCTPLLTSAAPRSVASYCLPASAGPKGLGEACIADEDCQSYLCLQHSRGRYCLRTCKVVGDCKIPAQCRSFDVTVTGIRGTINSCSSN